MWRDLLPLHIQLLAKKLREGGSQREEKDNKLSQAAKPLFYYLVRSPHRRRPLLDGNRPQRYIARREPFGRLRPRAARILPYPLEDLGPAPTRGGEVQMGPAGVVGQRHQFRDEGLLRVGEDPATAAVGIPEELLQGRDPGVGEVLPLVHDHGVEPTLGQGLSAWLQPRPQERIHLVLGAPSPEVGTGREVGVGTEMSGRLLGHQAGLALSTTSAQ